MSNRVTRTQDMQKIYLNGNSYLVGKENSYLSVYSPAENKCLMQLSIPEHLKKLHLHVAIREMRSQIEIRMKRIGGY